MSPCCSPDTEHASAAGDIVAQSVITCPRCGASKAEEMPRAACRIVYQCTGCGAVLRPKAGDCCVFCSYGSVPCPPIQLAKLT
jgi:hypothetical protein